MGALIPRQKARAEIAPRADCGLTVREMKLERKLYLVYRKSATLAHAARALLQVVRELQRAGRPE